MTEIFIKQANEAKGIAVIFNEIKWIEYVEYCNCEHD